MSEAARDGAVTGKGPSTGESLDELALGRLVQSFETKPDQQFLKKIVKDAADVIGADVVLINRLDGPSNKMKSLEIYDRDSTITDYVYDLEGTPCEQVVQRRGVCSVTKGVQNRFPTNTNLADMGVEGYIGAPLFAADGKVIGLFCTLFKREVTNPEFVATTLKLFSPRIAAEIERSEAEERTRLALRGGAAGIWDWSLENDEIHFTPEFLGRIGLDPTTIPVKGSEWISISHADDHDLISQAFRSHIVEGIPLDFNARIHVGEGVYNWVRLTAEAQRDEDGRAIRLYGTIADIDDLVRAQIDAQKANESKSAFLANMSHEIRTPMNAIMGMLQILSGSEVSIEQKDWIDTAYGAAESLLTVLNDILDLSRLEAGKVEIVKEPFEVAAFLSDLENIFSVSAAEKSLVLETNISQDVPARLNTDATRLRQILSNFLSNAIKFTKVGKVKVDVSVTNKHGFEAVEFSVCDTGLGISEEMQKRLFGRFEQEDMSTTRQFGGAGLGLAICREIATCLDGTVGMESIENVGSRFWVALPMWLSDENVSETESSRMLSEKSLDSDEPLAGIHALIAEDNIVNQRILKLLMTAFGAEVTVVSNGTRALERVKHEDFDIVLMDVSMPGISGYDATRAIRKLEGEASQVPIVAVTAHAMGGEADKALEAGMNGYVAKPIAAETLIEAILSVVSVAQDDLSS